MFLRSRILTWIGALAALFMVAGVPWVVYATASLTQSVVAPMEEVREDHEERGQRNLAEQVAPPPPQIANHRPRGSLTDRIASHPAMRPPTPACPMVRHRSRFSVCRLI